MIWYNYINAGLLIIIWLIIFFEFKKVKKNRLFWIIFFAMYTVTEFISMIFEIYGQNNLWLYNVSKPFQFIFLILYLVNLIKFNKSARNATLFISISLIALLLFSKKITEYNSLIDVTFSSVLLVLLIIYFYRLISNNETVNPRATELWYCTSLFMYFGAMLCINGTLNFLLKNEMEVARKLFYLWVINSYIFYIVTIYALLVSSIKQSKNEW